MLNVFDLCKMMFDVGFIVDGMKFIFVVVELVVVDMVMLLVFYWLFGFDILVEVDFELYVEVLFGGFLFVWDFEMMVVLMNLVW